MHRTAVALLFLLLLGGCITKEVSTETSVAATGNTPGVGIVENTVEFNVSADNFTFSPSVIRVHTNDRVIIHLTSVDTEHGIKIEGYNVHVETAQGETQTLSFIADKPGNFTLSCNVFCGSGHRTMKGQLIVE